MAKTSTERSAASTAKRKALGEEELRNYVRPGTRAKLTELMDWHDIKLISEAIQNLIINAHALGPEGSASAIAVPRHEIEVTEDVARALYSHGARQAADLDRAEQ